MTMALNRFISILANQCRPFFQLLHKWKDFTWTEECNQTFKELKKYLAHPPILSSIEREEVLFAYLVVTTHAVILVLVWIDAGVQKPIYYVSKSFEDAETKYLPLEKTILAIIHATKKLSHYFQAHTVVVLTQLPLWALHWRSNYTRRVAK